MPLMTALCVRTQRRSSSRECLLGVQAFLVLTAGGVVGIGRPSLADTPLEQVPNVAHEPFPGGDLALPKDLGKWLQGAPSRDDGQGIRLDTVAKPIDAVAQTPWKASAYSGSARPGFLMRKNHALPWGLEAEWQVGVVAMPQNVGEAEISDASRWSIRKAVGKDLYLYMHDRGSGFVKHFGDRLSVYGRYLSTGDKTTPTSLLQVGAARAF